MKLTDAFPSEYLKVADIPGTGMEFFIDDVKHELFEDPDTHDKEQKPVMSFKNSDKRLILNKTNWNRIAKLFGDDSDGWKGRTVVLYLEAVEAFGKTQDAIRVKA